MQNAIINVNGQILNSETAKISIFDRGFLYGDSLYEVIRTYDGKTYGMKEHMDRLWKSAALCKMTLSQKPELYADQIQTTLKAFKAKQGTAAREAYIRLIVTRGVGRIGFGLNSVLTPTQYVIIVQPLEPPTAEQYEKGLKIQVSSRMRNDPRALDPAMKSGNYLNSLLAYLESAEEGFDDAILCNVDGHVTEGTTFNIGYIRRGIVATPPLEIGILDGITRREMMTAADRVGLPVREIRFPRERLYEADEVFITSTIRGVFPVSRVDHHVIHGGSPGPLTRKLSAALQELVQERLAS